MKTALLVAGYSYLLGSIPFGYLLVRLFRGQDVRTTGSGNIGATNVARSFPLLGLLTLLLDSLKGLLAVLLVRVFWPGADMRISTLAAFCAIVGHIFPVWLKFRGGKGVATGLGAYLALVPKAILIALVVFAGLAAIFRYVSLGSIVAVSLLPFLAFFIDEWREPVPLLLLAASSLLIIAKHHANLRRLVAGNEPRFAGRK
jgi:acyl phosphate:glycerol-3-phosphate acyltransferase